MYDHFLFGCAQIVLSDTCIEENAYPANVPGLAPFEVHELSKP